MKVFLESVKVEGKKRTHTADAVAEAEPDIAEGGGGGGHTSPDGGVTGGAQLSLGTLALSILK